MQEKDYLKDWQLSLYSSLKDTKKDIREIEENKEYNHQLNEIQISRIEKWLAQNDLEPKLKEDLEESLDHIRNSEQDNERRLDWLKTFEKSTEFMIEKIKDELNQ